ncbi:unnamed protein product, partial [Owenia fusiformis]
KKKKKKKTKAQKKAERKAARPKTPEESDEPSSNDDSDAVSDDDIEYVTVGTSNRFIPTKEPVKPQTQPEKPKSKPIDTSNEVKQGKSSMGLDHFGTNSGSSSSHSTPMSSRATSQPPVGHPTYQAPSSATRPPMEMLPESFSRNYEHVIACSQCFEKIGNGYKGYRYHPNLSHTCGANFFLIRRQGRADMNWLKIRPRPKTGYTGPYKRCISFATGESCRSSPEDACQFPHSQQEVDLWTLDRENVFSIEKFIKDTKDNIAELGQKLSSQPESRPGLPLTQVRPSNQQNQMMRPQMGPPGPYNQIRFNSGVFNHNGFNGSTGPYQRPPAFGILPSPGPPRFNNQINPNMMNSGQPTPTTLSNTIGNRIDNPMKSSHDFSLRCEQCYRMGDTIGLHLVLDVQHTCLQDVLLFIRRGSTWWLKVRERKQNRHFYGPYALCNHYIHGNCSYEDNCIFAHNDVEQNLWTLEKDGKFSVSEFILQNRAVAGFSLGDLFQKHSGEFMFICKQCFYGKPTMISMENLDNPTICMQGHPWAQNKLLAHREQSGKIDSIGPQPFKNFGKKAYFQMCYKMQFCLRRAQQGMLCNFSHSAIEKDVWLLERDTPATQDDIVAESKKLHTNTAATNGANTQPAQATPTKSHPSSWAGRANAAGPPTTVQFGANVKQAGYMPPAKPRCPYRLQYVCQLCWKNGKTSEKNPKVDDRCTGPGNGHIWSQNKACLLLPERKVIRELPYRIPKDCNFAMCTHIINKRECFYVVGKQCQYAHCREEMDVWTWMVKNKVRTTEELVELCKEQAKAPITKGQPVVQVQMSNTPKAPQTVPTTNYLLQTEKPSQAAHYCHYCGVQTNSERQWESHCASVKHMFNVNSDKEHQWNYRQPPWGIPNGNYSMCVDHLNGKRCRYSYMQEFNSCQYAHTQEEMDEWKERYEWRQMKREQAKQEGLFSYMEGLLEDYMNAASGAHVISEQSEVATVECDQDLNVYENNKKSSHVWTFQVNLKNGNQLCRVALLHDKHRLHFSLCGEDFETNCQISPGDSFLEDNDAYNNPIYLVHVKFEAGMFGSFDQWVVFDVGTPPVIVRKLTVEVGTKDVQTKVKHLRQKLNFDRWTKENSEIVQFTQANIDPFIEETMKKYEPSSANLIVTQQALGVELNRHNYVHKMHKMLQLEEITRHQIISSFNLQTEIQIMGKIQEEAFIIARHGEFFAKVPLNDELSEDTDAGKLILNSVHQVLLKHEHSTSTKVYEAIFVSKENFDYDGRGKDYIYLCLSPTCCAELNLRDGARLKVEIQFQMDKKYFAELHYAVDQLPNTDVVFPDLNKVSQGFDSPPMVNVQSSILNEDQIKIVEHIVRENKTYTPPLIIYGPFGTGKTETIAQATMTLIRAMPNARVLICTQSNSAADLYITKHLGQFAKTGTMRLRRVYFTERRVNTVNAEVVDFCNRSPDGASFVVPTKEDIMNQQVVIVTLSSSIMFSRLGLKDCFTHIFIDEAAQALECEAITPLALANSKTCVALAGDPMQLGPKVYSPEACKQKFHHSLLERIFKFYETYASGLFKNRQVNILLKNNYRSKMEILRFISVAFYGGPQKLIPKSQQLPSSKPPLVFYAAEGKEIQDKNSVAYYNNAEIEEVTDRVEEIYNEWPEAWGERQPSLIGIVTPYTEQVLKIRASLRARSNALGRVVVQRMNNIQGQEYRVLVISTVRTRYLAMQPPKRPIQAGGYDGDNGDYGFLSDQKLLNTALTRAQSMVAVVGDPVALCSIGECMTLWRTYIKHCSNLHSIQPENITFDTIKAEVIRLMQSEYGENLLKLTQMMKNPENEVTNDDIPVENGDDDINDDEPDDVVDSSKQATDEVVAAVAELSIQAGADSDSNTVMTEIVADELQREKARKKKKGPDSPVPPVGNVDMGQNNFRSPVIVYGKPAPYPCTTCHSMFADRIEVDQQYFKDGLEPKENSLIACELDIISHNGDYISYMFVPLNESVTKIYNLETEKHAKKAKSGFVTVYSLNTNGNVVFDHYEPINKTKNDKIFVVRYLGLNATVNAPIGIVVGVLPIGDSLDCTKEILKIGSSVPQHMPLEVTQYIKHKFPSNYTLTEADLKDRVDFRNKITFSIGSPKAPINNALSVELLQDGTYFIGVHIVDVSNFIKKGDPIDNEALQRATTYETSGTGGALIPEQMSYDLLNLQPGHDCLTVSIFMTVDPQAIVKKVQIRRCFVKSSIHLSHQDVEESLTDDRKMIDHREVKQCLHMLRNITALWRKIRLGTMSLCNIFDTLDDNTTPNSKILTEEIEIVTNMKVADMLWKREPNKTPLLQQGSPNEADLNMWRQKYIGEATTAPCLVKGYILAPNVCQCLDICQCVARCVQPTDVIHPQIDVEVKLWEGVTQAVIGNNMSKLQELFLSPYNHSEVVPALEDLRDLLQEPQYCCIQGPSPMHYSLNIPVYTTLTKPLVSYMDIAIQRMLVAALEQQENPYTEDEITIICGMVNIAKKQAEQFSKDIRSATWTDSLNKSPACVNSVIETINQDELKFYAPNETNLRSITVPFKHLDCADASLEGQHWELRVYDTSPGLQTRRDFEPIRLNPDKLVAKIPRASWQNMVTGVVANDQPKVMQGLITTLSQVILPANVTEYAQEVTSEVASNVIKSQENCDVHLTLKPSGLLKVQYIPGVKDGVLSPSVQLVNLTPKLDLCVEHHEKSEDVFMMGAVSLKSASKRSYTDVRNYQAAWLPVVKQEAAAASMKLNKSIYIHNVIIRWQEKRTEEGSIYTGTFSLPLDFLKDRQIPLTGVKGINPNQGDDDYIYNGSGIVCDYLCVRYAIGGMPAGGAMLPGFNPHPQVSAPEPYTWVGHCIALSSNSSNNLVSVNVTLTQSAVAMPTEVLESRNTPCTVEWRQKTKAHRSQETALTMLNTMSTNDLAQGIAVGKPPTFEGERKMCTDKDLNDIPKGDLPKLNTAQADKLKLAANQPFTVIRGAAGTGKSMMATQLALLYVMLNKQSQSGDKMVMMCSSSEQGLNVLEDFLQQTGVRYVRMYSEEQERFDYPLPNQAGLNKVKPPPIADKYKMSALHHRIHSPASVCYQQIMDYERILMSSPDQVTQDYLQNYFTALRIAKSAEISKVSIVLCLCSEAANSLLKTVDFEQLIIDDCCMCTEPESMVPIVTCAPNQVVLFGDIWLRPKHINSVQAAELGLKESLFQRYILEAEMLEVQYRMHTAVAYFPMTFCYGPVACGSQTQNNPDERQIWPGGPSRPVVFCHIAGTEIKEGAQVVGNVEEAQYAVYISAMLVLHELVPASSVAILISHANQRDQIRGKLNQLNQPAVDDITITTLDQAQGRQWDYVIVSTGRSLPQQEIMLAPTSRWRKKYLTPWEDSNGVNLVMAITRAKKGLIILGNKYILEADDIWRALLEQYNKQGIIVEASNFMVAS